MIWSACWKRTKAALLQNGKGIKIAGKNFSMLAIGYND